MDLDPAPGRSEGSTDPAVVRDLLAKGIETSDAWNRPDLKSNLHAAQARLDRTTALVCIVGEYKQGKSLLTSALAGRRVCPVHDHLATTAITAVHHAERETVRVRQMVHGAIESEEVPFNALPRYVTEEGDPAARRGVEFVDVGLPSDALADGLILVDTPGVGGLLDHHARTTLRFLGLADAVVFVTDAGRELTASETTFLGRVLDVCPQVFVAMTKTDLYPEWKRILGLNENHLREQGLGVDTFPTSAQLRFEAMDRDDADLDTASGVPELLDTLRSQVVTGAESRNLERALSDLRWAMSRILKTITTQLDLIEDPEAIEDAVARLEDQQARYELLRSAGSRWATILNDGFSDLRAGVDHELRRGIRQLLTAIDQELEGIDPAADWDAVNGLVQERLSTIAVDLFTMIEEGAIAVRDDIADLLADEEDVLPELADLDPPDIAELRDDDPQPSADGSGVANAMATSLTALRGGSSGMILLGMIGQLAGIALAAPVSVGVAALFGAKQVADVKKAALRQRRQEARVVARSYVDDINLELSSRSRQLVQDLHRQLRDHYGQRLQQLSRSTSAALQQAQEGLSQERQSRQERSDRLRRWQTRLQDQLAAIDGIEDVP